MARPTTKQDLIAAANEKYLKMTEMISSISNEDQVNEFIFDISKDKEAHWKRDKNIRDVLIHLYEWHNLLLEWVASNMQGQEKSFLPEGYNWRTYGDMNIEFWKKHQKTSFEEAMALVVKSHEDVMQLADQFSNDQLFSKGTYDWVGGSTLGSYFVSTTASHYDWAMKKIRRHKKSLT
ncbi:ClbS/DfsB family four-helix bundle protein [Vagococcus elongatus]|uniref:ClbS/DfsB family four-helix bundle protein n=1 Tax=Vagococcus elongatus TaxID=180344 RepID=A0A430B5K9_9ENTE|nr:ClbS/DfsB family four-helix bundle protein [Vagococcus elongatus]RSU15599.1 hypothetical protein CBF29_00555 [Vagococcus elongatus]